MKHKVTIIMALIVCIGCAQKNEILKKQKEVKQKNQTNFFKPIFITEQNYSPEELSVMSMVPTQVNDYYDFSSNSELVLKSLNLTLATKCSGDKVPHNLNLRGIPKKVYIHQALSSEHLQKLLRKAIVCEFSINVKNEDTYYLQPMSTLRISPLKLNTSNYPVIPQSEIEYEFDFDFLNDKNNLLICDHFTVKPADNKNPSTIFSKVNAGLWNTQGKSYRNYSYSQLCGYFSMIDGKLQDVNAFKVLYKLPEIHLEQKFKNLYKNKGYQFHHMPMHLNKKLSDLVFLNTSGYEIQLRVPKVQNILWLRSMYSNYSRINQHFYSKDTFETKNNFLYFKVKPNSKVHLESFIKGSDVVNSCTYKQTLPYYHNSTNSLATYFINRIHLNNLKPIQVLADGLWVDYMLPYSGNRLQNTKISSIEARELMNLKYRKEVFKDQSLKVCK